MIVLPSSSLFLKLVLEQFLKPNASVFLANKISGLDQTISWNETAVVGLPSMADVGSIFDAEVLQVKVLHHP